MLILDESVRFQSPPALAVECGHFITQKMCVCASCRGSFMRLHDHPLPGVQHVLQPLSQLRICTRNNFSSLKASSFMRPLVLEPLHLCTQPHLYPINSLLDLSIAYYSRHGPKFLNLEFKAPHTRVLDPKAIVASHLTITM